MGNHNTISTYFDGNMLNLDCLAEEGILVSNMTKKQVERAAKKYFLKNRNPKSLSLNPTNVNTLIDGYLNLYSVYPAAKFRLQLTKLSKLRANYRQLVADYLQ